MIEVINIWLPKKKKRSSICSLIIASDVSVCLKESKPQITGGKIGWLMVKMSIWSLFVFVLQCFENVITPKRRQSPFSFW